MGKKGMLGILRPLGSGRPTPLTRPDSLRATRLGVAGRLVLAPSGLGRLGLLLKQLLDPFPCALRMPFENTEGAFFELLTSVKGIGYRKALRSLAMPIATVARAVAEKDVDTLRALPEIGKRTAETIVLDLAEKVEAMLPGLATGVSEGGTRDATDLSDDAGDAARDAITVLVQLGESRVVAAELVERARRADPTITEGDSLVAAALRLKEMVG